MAALDLLKNAFRVSNRNLTLGHNFRKYGLEFGVHDYDEFINKARKFYFTALNSEEEGYTILRLSRHRVAIDYKGEMRGVYDGHGEPLAFFRPDYHELGYDTPEHELDDFRAGKSPLFI